MNKIQLSAEELSMNGAPEGDLFNVEVLADSVLLQLNDDDVSDFIRNLNTNLINSDTSWAEQFRLVETLRSLLLYNRDKVTEFYTGTGTTVTPSPIVSLITSAAESLRSSTMRNGILAARLLILNVPLTSQDLEKVTFSVTTRMAGSPKFICDLAENSLTEALEGVSPLRAIDALLPLTSHKNADVASKAFIQVGKQISRLTADSLASDYAFVPLLQALAAGLNCKKVPGKDSSRNSLRQLLLLMGGEILEQRLAECNLLGSQMKQIQKEILTDQKVPVKRGMVSSEGPLRKRIGEVEALIPMDATS